MNIRDCAVIPLLTAAPVPQDQESTGGSESTLESEKLQKTLGKLKQGYTRIPNTILMEIVSGNLSKAEIKILLLTARFTISYKERETAPLSKSSIQRLTAVQGKGVLQAIQTLLAKGFLKKLVGNYYTKNQLGLIYDKNLFKSPDDLDPESELEDDTSNPASSNNPAPQGNKSTQDQKGTQGQKIPQGQDQKGINPQGVKSTDPLGQKSTHFKPYSINHNFINTLSPKSSTMNSPKSENPLQNYIQEVKPERKREAELKNLLSLQKDYPTERISTALNHVVSYGLLKSGEHCHSPMAYLAVAIREVLSEADKIQKRNNTFSEQKREQELKQSQQEEEAKREGEILEKRLLAFQNAFPSPELQNGYFTQFSRRYPVLNPNGPILRNLAIRAWSEESQSVQSRHNPNSKGIA